MKIVQHGKKRKAISPVLATVILIAITLIAAIAVAGFVFGLFGTFTSTAQIQVSSSVCTITGPPITTCVVWFQNTGTSTGTVSAISISFGGLGNAAMNCGATVPLIVTSGAAPVKATCTFTGTAVQGEQYTLSATASSGAQPLGAGTFSA